MRTLPIDLEFLGDMMESERDISAYYLDTQTGEIAVVSQDLLLEEPPDRELPEWQEEQLALARAILENTAERYVEVPQVETREAYDLMAQFAKTVTDPQLARELDIALAGRGAFSRFRYVLYGYADEKERWFAFKRAASIRRAREWVEELGITPVEAKPTKA
jgi:hypothetical protein